MVTAEPGTINIRNHPILRMLFRKLPALCVGSALYTLRETCSGWLCCANRGVSEPPLTLDRLILYAL